MLPPERRYEYHQIELPAFPGLILPIALDDEGRAWIPVKAICDGLGVQDRAQRDKLRTDDRYHGLLRPVPFQTIQGWRDMSSLEFEGFGPMLTDIQDRRIRNPAAQERVRLFRRQAWAAINDVVLGRRQPSVIASPGSHRGELAGLRALALQTEDRVGRLESAVFISPEDDEEPGRSARCPHCGGPIRVAVGNILVVADE